MFNSLNFIFHKIFYLLKISTNWRLFSLYQTFSLLFYWKKYILKRNAQTKADKRPNRKKIAFFALSYSKLIYFCSPWHERSKYIRSFCQRHKASKLLLVKHRIFCSISRVLYIFIECARAKNAHAVVKQDKIENKCILWSFSKVNNDWSNCLI